MKDNRSIGVRAASLAASYEHYFGPRRLALAPWWRAVNAALEDEGRAQILFRTASQWWAQGLTPAQAVARQLDNLDSAQEERSYYDV